jgi:nucleotide-binding universal stress UspA family protein
MKRFKRVVLATWGPEDPEPAAREAVALASRNHAALTVIDVLPPLPRSLARLERGDAPVPAARLIQAHREQRLRSVVERLDASLKVEYEVLFGTPFLEITREVIRGGHELVIAVAERPRGLRGALLGSDSMHLVRKCPSAVWLVKPDAPAGAPRVLAAVDPDPELHDAIRDGLNDKIIEIASSLARVADAELHVVHAWSPYAESMLRGRAGLSDALLEGYLDETQAAHQHALGSLLERHDLSGLDLHPHLVRGGPSKVIVDLARTTGAGLVVIGTVCRTGVAGLLIGNTAETIIQHLDASIMTVKPEGFVSPVAT